MAKIGDRFKTGSVCDTCSTAKPTARAAAAGEPRAVIPGATETFPDQVGLEEVGGSCSGSSRPDGS